MSTSFTLHLSKTKIDDFTICTVYKFDTVYRKNPIYRKFRYDRKTHTDKPILVSLYRYTEHFYCELGTAVVGLGKPSLVVMQAV